MSTLKHTAIIGQMTLAEKVSMLSGKDFWQTKSIPRLGIPSIYLADGPHGVRRQAAAAERMGLNAGIPSTCYPTEAMVANSWNVELGEKVGSFLGNEAVSQGVSVLLGPGINMKRNPLCGRNFEYFSEDPFLAGKMAAAYVRGIQSRGIAACVKHFAVSNQEWRIMSLDAVVDERTLREIYLTAFEIAVREGNAKVLMSAYNKVNGTHANENLHLMREILRNDWGYAGCVITNWGGNNDRVAGLIAGNELEMPGSHGDSDREILDALARGEIGEELIDENLDRLLDLVFSTSMDARAPQPDFNITQHHRVSQRVAEESIVLLKNDDAILPLAYSTKVAVIGAFASSARYQGAGSSLVNPTVLDNTLDCFDESGITSIGYESGYDRYGKPSHRRIEKACRLAEKADTVLLYLGLDELSEAQGLDRDTMRLPKNQEDLLAALFEVNRNIVVILSCGCAVEMPWIDKTKGLLHAYLSGQAGARAILRVISGDVNPSGKLAESYPLRYGDTPSFRNFPGNELTVEYREGIYIGYRYYDTAGIPVLFPFGYGLSYTTFLYSDMAINGDHISFNITNTGNIPGMEVAQLYIGKADSRIPRPAKELKGFVKVLVQPGQSKQVRISFNEMTFRYFDVIRGSWAIEPGTYQVLIGSSSRDIHLRAETYMQGDTTLSTGTGGSDHLPSYFSGSVQDVQTAEFTRLLGRDIPPVARDRQRPFDYDDTISQCRYARSGLARLSFHAINVTYRLLRRTGRRDLSNLLMMSVYHLPFRGIARLTGGKINLRMVDGLLLMVNGRHIRGLYVLLKGWIRKGHR